MKYKFVINHCIGRALALLVCCSIGFSSAALAQEGPKYELKVSPPRTAVQNEPVTIGVEYTSPVEGEPGKAVVDYHNVDTGQTFTKEVEIPLTKGKHKVEATWDANDSLPHGMYVITVVLNDAAGKEIARFASSPDQVQSMMVHGGALTRMFNAEQVTKDVEDLVTWREELETLEAAAAEAGADTTRHKILITVLSEAKFWSGESLGGKRYDILDSNHKYLKGQYEQAKAQLEALADDPNAFPGEAEAPRPEERFTIRDGGFFAGETRMYLNGPCFFNFTIRYLPVARELGFNVIQVSTGPNSIFETSAEPTGLPRVSDYNENTKTGVLIDILDECAELGIKVDLGMTSHFMPKWAFEKWPDARNQFVLYNMQPYDIEHPEMLKIVEGFYEHVMPIIAGHPALNSIWIANEPEYMNPNERNMAIFRPWLKEKYGTIEALNETWGTELASFDDIVASGRKGHPVPDACSTNAARYDWWKYSTERLMHHYEWQKELIRKYEPDLPIAVKNFNATFNPQFKPMSRADEESTWDRMDYMGISGGSFPFSKSYKDFARSLDPTKPLANLEYKFGGVLTKLFFWQETMQGATSNNWWCWHPNPAFSSVPKVSQSVHQAALAKLDIQRLLPQIRAFHELPGAPMVLVYPDPLAGRYWEFFAFNDHTNRALTEMGFNVDYATENRIAEGRLDMYEVLVLPSSNFIRDETYEKVKAAIEGGKTAIVLGAIPENDEYDKPRDASLFKPGADAVEIDFGEYKATKYSAGAGTIYHLPTVPRSADGRNHLTSDSANLIREFLEQALAEALPVQPVVIRDAEGKPFIENRTVSHVNEAGETVYLTYVVNDWLDSARTIEPKFGVSVTGCRDLITHEVLDPARIEIPAADVRLLEFTVAP